MSKANALKLLEACREREDFSMERMETCMIGIGREVLQIDPDFWVLGQTFKRVQAAIGMPEDSAIGEEFRKLVFRATLTKEEALGEFNRLIAKAYRSKSLG